MIVQGYEAFIGVSRSARSKDGASMIDLAKLKEFGGPPVIIPITPKKRRFLFALLRQAGKEPTGGSGRGAIVVRVPARPSSGPRSTSPARARAGASSSVSRRNWVLRSDQTSTPSSRQACASRSRQPSSKMSACPVMSRWAGRSRMARMDCAAAALTVIFFLASGGTRARS